MDTSTVVTLLSVVISTKNAYLEALFGNLYFVFFQRPVGWYDLVRSSGSEAHRTTYKIGLLWLTHEIYFFSGVSVCVPEPVPVWVPFPCFLL
jgi:hypothetical protein